MLNHINTTARQHFAVAKPSFKLAPITLALSLVLMTIATGTIQQVHAAELQAQQQIREYNISAGPLAEVINLFASTSKLALTFDAAILRGLQSNGLRGKYSITQGFEKLLEGRGLQAQVNADGSYILKNAPVTVISQPEKPETLPEVTVNATTSKETEETATSHVNGYVAKRSATGTKTDISILETPQSISVVTADQIISQGATSLSDTLAYTPGVTIQSQTFSRMVDDLTIRGFNVANGNLGSLRDGMKLQSNVYDGGQEPYGLERIEVLRGASSMLYGQLAPGGVVNAISKRPTVTPLHELNVSYGSYDRKQVSGDFGSALTDDGTISYRLTGLYRDADNWVKQTPDDKVYIAPSITYAPDDQTSLTLLSSYQRFHTRFTTPLQVDDVAAGNIPRNMFLGNSGFDRYNGTSWTLGYLFEHTFNNGLKLKNNARYFQSDADWDYMTGNLATLEDSGGLLARIASKRYEQSYGATMDTSAEYSFDTSWAEHTVLAGVDYYRRSYDSRRYRGRGVSFLDLDSGTVLNTPAINYAVDRGSENSGNQYGLYVQDQIKFDDHWRVLLGLRKDWSDSKTLSSQTKIKTQQNDDAVTSRAGLVYLFDNGIAPYASVSQSFQPQVGIDNNTGNALKPNEGLQYEVGTRYQPVGSNVLLSAAVYELTQRNLTTTDSNGLTYQQGKVRSRGVELEARASFGNLRLISAYTYTDASILQSAKPNEVNQQVNLVPYNAVSLWADYKLDGIGVRGLTVGGGTRYSGETSITDSDRKVPGYTLVDAMASFDLETLSSKLQGTTFRLNARNLFDKKYYSCTFSDGCRYGEPTTVTATFSYRW